MKNITLFWLLFTNMFLVLTSGCTKDWLDVKPNKTQITPETIVQLQTLLDNEQNMNWNVPFWGNISNDDFFISDEVVASAIYPYERNAYLWKSDIYEGDIQYVLDEKWTFPYRMILNSNIVLEGAEKIKQTVQNQLDINQLKGRAYFYRAHAYFWLTQNFVPTYNQETVNQNLGVPIRLEAGIEAPSIRATVQQNYDQIISDLLWAGLYLTAKNDIKTRPCKSAAFALLARTYLVMDEFKNAQKYADSCLKYKSDLLDYNTISLTSPTSYPIPIYNEEVLFHARTTLGNLTGGTRRRVDRDLFASFENDDLRRTLWFRLQTDGNQRFYGSYEQNVIDFAGVTVPEAYLIRAECAARKGDIQQAMDDLNYLLKTRYKTGTFMPLTAPNAEEALRIVLQERRKEMIFRNLRWSDLRRLNKDPRFAMTLTRVYAGEIYTLPPNDPRYTFPIPLKVIELSGLPQNVR